MSDFLLDTCALLWLAEGIELAADARKAVANGKLNVSAISVWEIANLARKNRIVLTMPVAKWFQQTLHMMEAALSELTIEILRGVVRIAGFAAERPGRSHHHCDSARSPHGADDAR